jgi:hypothetical protein
MFFAVVVGLVLGLLTVWASTKGLFRGTWINFALSRILILAVLGGSIFLQKKQCVGSGTVGFRATIGIDQEVAQIQEELGSE